VGTSSINNIAPARGEAGTAAFDTESVCIPPSLSGNVTAPIIERLLVVVAALFDVQNRLRLQTVRSLPQPHFNSWMFPASFHKSLVGPVCDLASNAVRFTNNYQHMWMNAPS
jgi:hypothetical protein